MLLGLKMGCVTILIRGVAAFFLLGPGANMLSMGGGTSDPLADSRSGANVACDTEGERFACNVFGSTRQVWGELINGYQKPTLNFFTDQNRSGCGAAQAAIDRKSVVEGKSGTVRVDRGGRRRIKQKKHKNYINTHN